jgi:ribonuclease Y
MPTALAMLLAGVIGACVGLWLALRARARLRQRRHAWVSELDSIRATAVREGQAKRVQAEMAAREEALILRAAAEEELRGRQVQLAEQEAALAGRVVLADEEARALEEVRQELAARARPLAEMEKESQVLDEEIASLRKQRLGELARVAKTTATAAIGALVESEIESARALAEQVVRAASEGPSVTEVARAAKRLMGISCGRMADRFYSEAAPSLVPLPAGRSGEPVLGADDLRQIEGVAGVLLSFTSEGDAVRIEGLDGVGREVARRCLGALIRRPGLRGGAFAKLAAEITAEVDREILEFGQRGFALLKIERAHPDIVRLVGRLIFRTSYTQSQWEHSVESGYLCGMMAAELGMDVKLARRAALLHDIGKALTHEMEGSHALIGADHARRLGESESVANAIGAHHDEEPYASALAHLVAAADAMSGGRPGARRQAEGDHVAKLAEIERIAHSFRGVGEAFAVQGGREVRVYVEESRVSDGAAGKLASDIAQEISRQMTFPGQIKVTVIREFKAIELAT